MVRGGLGLFASLVAVALAHAAESGPLSPAQNRHAFALPPPREAVLLTDLSGDLPSPGGEEALGLRLRMIRPADSGRGGDVYVVLRRSGNQWTGEGHVAFTVRKIELVRWGESAGAPPSWPVSLAVELRTNMEIGDTREIPRGLFGWRWSRWRPFPN